MSISLDIGTTRFRSLRRVGGELVGRSVPATFALVPDDPTTRKMLAVADLSFADADGELALIGDGVLEHAATLRTTPLRVLPGGLVAADDPPARQLLATLLESILPEAAQPGESCGVVLPAAAATDYESRNFLLRLIQMQGFTPVEISAPHAVSLATLSTEGFTGVSVILGAGEFSLSVTHRGRELVTVREPRGVDWIDAQLAATEKRHFHDAAGERYLDTESIRKQREMLAEPLTRPTTDFAVQIAELYRQLLRTTLAELSHQMERESFGRFNTPLPIVCAGGGTRAPGFSALLSAVLTASDFPIDLGTVRLARHDEYVTARGALIHAELENVTAAVA